MTSEPIPIACTLDADEVPGRVTRWRDLLQQATARETREDGTRHIDFAGAGPAFLEDLARLVALEQACCAFFTFVVTVDASGVSLDVRAPDGAGELVDQLFAP